MSSLLIDFISFLVNPPTPEPEEEMGSSASKTANTNAADTINIDKSGDGGLHVLEFHLPSAGIGATLFIGCMALLLVACLARKYRLCKKVRRRSQPAIPMVVQPQAPQQVLLLLQPAPTPVHQALPAPMSPAAWPTAPPMLPPSLQKWG